jgi:hypothetical protein
MSNPTILIVTGVLPDDPAITRQYFEWMIEDLNREASRMGWEGVDFIKYGLAGGWALVEGKPGTRPASLERLTAFRDEERRRREEEERQVA